MSSPANTSSTHRRRRPQRHQQDGNSGIKVLTRASTIPMASSAKVDNAVSDTTMMTANDIDQNLIEKIKQREVVYDIDEHQYVDKKEKVWKDMAKQHGVTSKYKVIYFIRCKSISFYKILLHFFDIFPPFFFLA